MKISLNWLKDYVRLDASIDEICRAITLLGFEVEQVIRTGAPQLGNVVVGEVLVRDKHPNADKLSVCQVDTGAAGGVKTIVCGAQNYKVGDRVPVALPGAVLPGNFVIKQSNIRGQASDGMMLRFFCQYCRWFSVICTLVSSVKTALLRRVGSQRVPANRHHAASL